jgi:hypothetical protein
LLAMVAVASADPWAARLGEWVALQQRRAVVDAWEAAGLNEGLISYWAMRTSGTTVIDEYGSNDGTAVNTPTFSEANGVRDDGVGLNGSNQYITLANADDFANNTNGTITAWVYQGAYATSSVFSRGRSGGTTWYFSFSVSSDGKPALAIRNAAEASRIDGTDTITTSAWNHIAVTADGTAWKLYLNGVDISGSVTVPSGGVPEGRWFAAIASQANRQTIGALVRNAVAIPFNGSLDEVVLWSRALSSNEVYKVYSTPLYAPYKEE